MSQLNTTPAAEPSLTQQITALLKYWFRGRRGLIALAAVVLGTGAYFNWSWLVAAGIAPVLVALAPCAAMCALGLCMNRGAGDSCSSGEAAGRKAADGNATGPVTGTDQLTQINPPVQRKENKDA